MVHTQNIPKSLEEAECLLDLACAKRDSQWAAKRLATVRLRESWLRTKLHLLQAREATRVWGDAEVDVGCISLMIEQSGYLVHPSPSQALQTYYKHGMLFMAMSWCILTGFYAGNITSTSMDCLTARLD